MGPRESGSLGLEPVCVLMMNKQEVDFLPDRKWFFLLRSEIWSQKGKPLRVDPVSGSEHWGSFLSTSDVDLVD